MSAPTLDLLEREAETATLRGAIGALAEGAPSVALLTGLPGSGRSALAATVTAPAQDLGVTVLSARGSLSESELPYGLISQLACGLDDAEQTELLRPLWDREVPEAVTERLLCARLLAMARHRPLLLVLDDVHLADRWSAQWLRMLLRRLRSAAGAPVMVLAVGVGGSPSFLHEEFALDSGPGMHLLRLTPLSRDGVSAMVRTAPVPDLDPTDVYAATGGNPSLVQAVLSSRRGTGRESIDAVVRTAARQQLSRLVSQLPDHLLCVLRLTAIAGRSLDLRLMCSLAGNTEMSATKAYQLLMDVGLVPAEPGAEMDPAVVECALAGMSTRERQQVYGRAAEVAHRRAAPDLEVATLLLRAGPVGQEWALGVLHAAADHSRAEGDPDRAGEFLTRALAEPMDPALRQEVELELASMETAGAVRTSDLRLAQTLLGSRFDGGTRVRLAAADQMLVRGSIKLARRVLASIDPEADPSTQDELEALLLMAGRPGQRIDKPGEGAAAVERSPARAGATGWLTALAGYDVEGARRLARLALAPGQGMTAMFAPRLAAAATLMLTDDVVESMNALESLIAEAGTRGARSAGALALVIKAQLNLRGGRLAAAQEDTTAALEIVPLRDWHPGMEPLVIGLDMLLKLTNGEIDAAARLNEIPRPSGQGFAWSYLLFSRGSLEIYRGRMDIAAAHFRECGRWMLNKGWFNPAVLPWRSLAVAAGKGAGEVQAATDAMLADEWSRAQAWGTRTTIGLTHLWAAEAGREEDAIFRLTQAVQALRQSPARVWHVHTVLRLIGKLLDNGQVTGAMRLLADADRLASANQLQCQLRAVRQVKVRLGENAEQRQEELPAPSREILERVVRGESSADIAAALSVGKRNVEMHLTRIYRHYGVEGRPELRALLARSDEGF